MVAVHAHYNWGRWCAPCPACPASYRCDGVTETSIGWGDPLYCVECGAGPIRVVYPSDVLRVQIEEALSIRPFPAQNWTHDVQVAELHAENREMLGLT